MNDYLDVPYVGGPLDGNTEQHEPSQIPEFLAKGFYFQYEESYDPRTPGTHPVHRYDLRRGEAGELELTYGGIMPPGTYRPGRVDDFAHPNAVPELDDDPECE